MVLDITLINKLYPNNWQITYTDVLICKNISDLLYANLCNILKKMNWFIYINNFTIYDDDIKLLFEINNLGILTCNLFNQLHNDEFIYGDDERVQLNYSNKDLREKRKKYISCFIPNSMVEHIYKKYKLNNNNNNYNNKSIKFILQNKLQNELQDNIIIYDFYMKPIQDINKMFYILQYYLNKLNPNIVEDINKNYTFITIYENELETDTNIIKYFHNLIVS